MACLVHGPCPEEEQSQDQSTHKVANAQLMMASIFHRPCATDQKISDPGSRPAQSSLLVWGLIAECPGNIFASIILLFKGGGRDQGQSSCPAWGLLLVSALTVESFLHAR
eukprot:scaffold198611_cov19-Tisochrysis_lutea.AAC.1